MNYARTAILLAGLTALFMAIGYLFGGPEGMLIALVIAVAMNLFSYWRSDKLVLSMYGAQEVDDRTAPEFVGLVRELSTRAGLPMPRCYLMDNPQPNAFATGRGGGLAALLAVLLAPLAAMLVQMAISRTREYAADRGSAQLSGDPLGLVSALGKLDNAARQIENPPAQRNPATAPLFIVNPLSGVRMDNLISTHPSTEYRIAALEELAGARAA